MAVQQISQNANAEDINTLYDCANQYFQLCAQNNMKVTNTMAYLACGLTPDQITDWFTGRRRASQPEYMQFAKGIKSICSAYREQISVEGKLNPVLAIWHQKVYDGYREDTPVAMPESTEREEMPDTIAAKYSDY